MQFPVELDAATGAISFSRPTNWVEQQFPVFGNSIHAFVNIPNPGPFPGTIDAGGNITIPSLYTEVDTDFCGNGERCGKLPTDLRLSTGLGAGGVGRGLPGAGSRPGLHDRRPHARGARGPHRVARTPGLDLGDAASSVRCHRSRVQPSYPRRRSWGSPRARSRSGGPQPPMEPSPETRWRSRCPSPAPDRLGRPYARRYVGRDHGPGAATRACCCGCGALLAPLQEGAARTTSASTCWQATTRSPPSRAARSR